VMVHPDLEVLTEARAEQLAHGDGSGALGQELPGSVQDSFGAVVPIYTEVEGVPPRTLRRILRRALDEYLPAVRDLLPAPLIARRKLLGLREAMAELHFPTATADEVLAGGSRGEAHRRLAFEELFLVQLGLALKRRGTQMERGIAFSAVPEAVERIVGSLPWPLTGAQRRAVAEIAADMRSPQPMNRLLQGDVGSGKTAVALVAARLAALDGYQTALMAATEILAEQHARTLRALLRGQNVHVELVTGSLGARERAFAERLARNGTAQIVVGTHALAEEGMAFHRLGLAVIDEQHRFGVLTRQRLMGKGARPDTLVMTATPIPRTLALTLYGDLDVSVLDELPPGRTPVATRVFRDAQRERALEIVRRELGAGRQVYVVLPLVEESEKLAELKAATAERARLQREVFPGLPIGLVHGRQRPEERAAAMDRFRDGQDRILVATTVIEVGVDVPNATVMLVEHAERFGLSQLHQLRGRVGRGAAKSHCLLVTGTTGAEFGPLARERLKVMEQTTDGFRIAEADLSLRGPGEVLGTRQSGLPDFAVAELARDQKILAEARTEAFDLIAKDPELSAPENAELKKYLFERWRGRLSLARVG
jgi:ATP-dependent DNA helicase RecG